MKFTKRELPPYYLGSLLVVFLVYFYTVGSYFESAPLHWVRNKTLGQALSIILFVGGMMVFQQVFDRLYPKIAATRLSHEKTAAPKVVKVAAFAFDLVLSFVAAVVIVTLLFGRHTGGGNYSVTGWATGVPFLLVFLYFFLMDRYAGGTLGKRVFHITRD